VLKEAFQLLLDTGRSSADVVVKPAAEPAHVYYLRRPDGSLDRVEADRPPWAHEAHSLQAVVAIAKEAQAANFASVWYGADHVTALFGEDLRNRVRLGLAHSEPFLQLHAWRTTKAALTQVELVRSLRTTFRDALAQAGELVNVLKRVNFTATAATQGEVGHGRASLGKQIAGEVTGTGVIPEYVTFNFPVFANACLRALRGSVECALEPDAATGTFRVIPLPGQLELAAESALAALGEQLRAELGESGVGLYYGRP
jgi:hypothetical protein